LHLINKDIFCNLCPEKNEDNFMSKTKLIINKNGSIKIEGDFEIMDSEGTVYGLQGRSALGLCRCGLSANKPFCDGGHRNNFEHDSVAFDLPPMKTN
jgi:CDGSH-type Zn-finger protein